MSSKSVEQKKVRIVEERQDGMEAMIEALINKFDVMINRLGVPSHKKKKVKMLTIRVIVNDESVDDNSEEEKEKDDIVDYSKKFQMQ
jgi:hypothetical protein